MVLNDEFFAIVLRICPQFLPFENRLQKTNMYFGTSLVHLQILCE